MGIIGRISRLSLVVEKELEPVFVQWGLNHWSFDMLATLRRTGAPYMKSGLKAPVFKRGMKSPPPAGGEPAP
jgi:hypothetical protein